MGNCLSKQKTIKTSSGKIVCNPTEDGSSTSKLVVSGSPLELSIFNKSTQYGIAIYDHFSLMENMDNYLEFKLAKKEGVLGIYHIIETCIMDIAISVIYISLSNYPHVEENLKLSGTENSKRMLKIAQDCRNGNFLRAKERLCNYYNQPKDLNNKWSQRGCDDNRIISLMDMEIKIGVTVRCGHREMKKTENCYYVILKSSYNIDSENIVQLMTNEYFETEIKSQKNSIISQYNCPCCKETTVAITDLPVILPLRIPDLKYRSGDISDDLEINGARYKLLSISLFHQLVDRGHYSSVLVINGKRWYYDSYEYNGILYEHGGTDPPYTFVTAAYYVRV